MYAGPSFAPLQDVKVRNFDTPGHQLWWKEHHVRSTPGIELGAGLGYFFHKNFGLRSEFFYSELPLSVNMEGTQFGTFTMTQRRYGTLLSLAMKRQVDTLHLSSIYGSMGLGGIYANFDHIPGKWALGGQFSVGTDLASNRRSNVFIELKYIWHHDIGDRDQSPGQRLKTSGNPQWNPANFMFGPHYDTQIIGLVFGVRFKLRASA